MFFRLFEGGDHHPVIACGLIDMAIKHQTTDEMEYTYTSILLQTFREEFRSKQMQIPLSHCCWVLVICGLGKESSGIFVYLCSFERNG